MSSGRRRMKNQEGPTTNANVSRPNKTQVARHPMFTMSDAASTGMATLAKPCPMLASARARPRMRTNQREIVTFTTIWPMSASPGLTRSQRKSMNCKKPRAWPSSRNPVPQTTPPAAISHLPP